jgi:two-component system phosphate regulon sensor histidine kinase PhoR
MAFLWVVLAALGVVLAVVTLHLRDVRSQLAMSRLRVSELSAEVNQQARRLRLLDPLRMMSEVAFDGLMLVDSERNVRHMNAVAAEMFGREFEASPHVRQSVMLVTRNHEIDDLIRNILEHAEDEEYVEQVDIRGTTYRVRAMRVTAASQAYVALGMEDVSELQRLSRARREFVANISHELRTPITSIRLLADTILRGTLRDTEDNRQTLRKIAAETEVLHQMAQELLDLSMIESGRAEFILRPTPLADIVDTAIELFTERAHRKQLTITYKAPATDVVVLADREQLRRVISNLLHNAIKFTPRKGKIIVEVDNEDEEWVTISVTDTGPGISPQARERIFERFYRGDRARHTEGTGLGLAIAKHIVSAHGGTIWSEEPPRPPGARICFRVPRP